MLRYKTSLLESQPILITDNDIAVKQFLLNVSLNLNFVRDFFYCTNMYVKNLPLKSILTFNFAKRLEYTEFLC